MNSEYTGPVRGTSTDPISVQAAGSVSWPAVNRRSVRVMIPDSLSLDRAFMFATMSPTRWTSTPTAGSSTQKCLQCSDGFHFRIVMPIRPSLS